MWATSGILPEKLTNIFMNTIQKNTNAKNFAKNTEIANEFPKKIEEIIAHVRNSLLLENVSFSSEITDHDAKIISDGIAAEKDHMIQNPPEKIMADFANYGGIIAHINGKVAGAMKLTLLDEEHIVYEAGSLFVMPEFRDK